MTASGTGSAVDRLRGWVTAREPVSYNTDWDGSLVIRGLLEWDRLRGTAEHAAFAATWFDDQVKRQAGHSDEDFQGSFTGVRSRVLRAGPLLFSGYCGTWGAVYPAELLPDPRTGEVVSSVAHYLLHRAGRSPHGCVYHDDHAAFLIPDTLYFAAPMLAIAGERLGERVYLDQAIEQLTAYLGVVQDPRTGLAFTMWRPSDTPEVYWSRAQGWLGGALANTLPFVPADDPRRPELVRALDALARAVVEHQRADGGFHVLVDDPSQPVDPTGPAMIAYFLEKSVRCGLLSADYQSAADAAWAAAKAFIGDDGTVRGAYTGWAATAVERAFPDKLFGAERDFVPGLMLLAAAWCERN